MSATSFGADYIVKSKQAGKVKSLNMAGLTVLDFHEVGQIYKVAIDEKVELEVLTRLHQDSNIEYVVKNFQLHALRAPFNPTKLKEQWANAKVRAEEAWQIAGNRGSRDVMIAVIDTGVDYNHESLKSNAVPGYDFRDNDNDPMDETSSKNPGHGTHCSGSLGATGEAGDGVIGLSPEVSIMPIRFLGADGSGDLMAGIKSIDYAIEKKAQIISASWGASVPRSQATPLIEAVQRADDAGIIFVAAAANDGRNNDTRDVFPANSKTPNMIAVAASGPQDEKPSWSNYGTAMVDLASPGLNIMSTLPQNKYGNLSGTSMATPLVAGLVALLKAQNPELTGRQIRSLLQTTGAKVSIETACNCRVDAASAMKALKEEKMFIAPAAATVLPSGTLNFEVVNGKAPFSFSTSNTAVGAINDSGLFTATATEGETVISVKDVDGQTVQSLAIHVKAPGGGGGGGGGGECPVQDPALCEALCQIMPDLPFCNN